LLAIKNAWKLKKIQAKTIIIKSQQCFKEAGIVRDWNLKDIIFDIDIENKKN
jgi:hypothetical protein